MFNVFTVSKPKPEICPLFTLVSFSPRGLFNVPTDHSSANFEFQKPARCFVASRKLLPTFQVLTNLRSHARVITEI